MIHFQHIKSGLLHSSTLQFSHVILTPGLQRTPIVVFSPFALESILSQTVNDFMTICFSFFFLFFSVIPFKHYKCFTFNYALINLVLVLTERFIIYMNMHSSFHLSLSAPSGLTRKNNSSFRLHLRRMTYGHNNYIIAYATIYVHT